MTIMEETIARLDPIICTGADGSQTTADDPLSGIPFASDLAGKLFGPITGGNGQPCTPGPTLAQQVLPAGPQTWFHDGATNIVKALSTFWVGIPQPQIGDEAGNTVGTTDWLTHQLGFYVAAVMVAGVLVSGGRIAWAGVKGREPLEKMINGIVHYLMVSSVYIAVVSVTVGIGQAYSVWIIDQATGGTDFGTHLTAMLLGGTDLGALGPVLTIGLLALVIVAATLQAAIILWRHGALVVLCGIWQLTAAAELIMKDGQAYDSTTGKIWAYDLYLPAAATIYAVAFRFMGAPGSGPDPIAQIITGVMWMFMAMFALGYLMKVCQPVGQQNEGGGNTGRGLVTAASLAIYAKK